MELSKQLEALRSDMKRLGELSGSINKLAQSLDKVGNAATVAKNATKGLNSEAGQAIKIVKQYATEQEKAASKAKTLNNAVKAGNVDRKTALTAETRLLQDVIKKTGDLSVLQSKRGSNGRFGFGGFSTEAVKAVRDQVTETNKGTQAAKQQLEVDKQDLSVSKEQVRIQKELAFIRKTSGKFSTAAVNFGTSFGPTKTGAKIGSTQYGPNTKLYDNYQKYLSEGNTMFEATRKQIAPNTTLYGGSDATGKTQKYYTDLGKALKADETAQNQLAKATRDMEGILTKYKAKMQAGYNATNQNIFQNLFGSKLANNKTTQADYNKIFSKKNMQQTFYGYDPVTHQFDDGSPKRRSGGPNGPYGSSGGNGGNGSGAGGRPNLGPSPASFTGVQKLYEAYVRLGHMLFLFKYSFLTIFGLSGIGYIVKQVDAYITLRNQIARTSQTIFDLGENMASVKKIANETFSDISSVGQIFSSINKYSSELKLSKEQVGAVTRNIASAYAASPGTAEAKGAAQYQLIQAITSNRLGGDELRSQLEQAPLVAEILQKQVAKIRGKEGQAIDLRDSKHPVTTAEIVAAFSSPEVTAELKRLLGQQARTFGDAVTVLKNRMVDAGAAFEKMLGPAFNSFARFLSDDTSWKSFVTGLQAATVAITAFTLAIITKGLFTKAAPIVGAAASGIGNYVSRAAAFASRPGSFTGNAAADAFAGIAATGKLVISDLIGILIKGFTILLSPATLIVAAITILAARFNYLLNKFGSGTSIFDILSGAMSNVSIAVSGLAGVLKPAIDGLWSLIDGPLMWLVKFAKNDQATQSASLARNFGVSTAKAITTPSKNAANFGIGPDKASNPFGANSSVTTFLGGKPQDSLSGFTINPTNGLDLKGKPMTNLSGTVKKSGIGIGGGDYLTKVGSPDLLNIYGDDGKVKGYVGRTSGIPAGSQSKLPKRTSTDKHKKDPWLEFITDTQLKIDEAIKLRGVSPAFKEVEQAKRDIEKRAADVLNLGSFEELQSKFAGKTKEVDILTTKMRDIKFAEKVAEFTDNMMNELVSAFQDSINSNLPDFEKQLFDIRNKSLNGLVNNPIGMVQGVETTDQQKALQEKLTKNSAIELYNSGDLKLTDAGQKTFEKQTGSQTNNLYTTTLGGFEKEINAKKEAFDLEKNLYGLYGRRLDLSRGINDIELKYMHIRSSDPLIQKQINDLKQREVNLATEAYDLESKRRGSAMQGIREAVSNSIDQLNDVAGAVGSVFSNVFSSLSDHLVSFIRTGKFGLKSMLNGILDDVTKLFVDQKIMKPLMNTIGGFLGIDTRDEGTKILDAHVQGAQTVYNKIISAFQDAQIGTNTDVLNANSPTGGFDFTSFIPKDFSFDGSGLSATGTQGFDFISALDGVFKENTQGGLVGGLKGTLGGILKGAGSFLGSLFGGGSSGGGNALGTIVKTAAKILPFFFHDGGIAGAGKSYRSMDPSIFSSAKRYHSGGFPGLNAAEVPAILQRGERVLSVHEQTKAGGSNSVFAPNISLTYNAAPSSAGSGNTPEAQKEHAKIIQDMVQQAMRKEIIEYDRQRSMPGTSAYLGARV